MNPAPTVAGLGGFPKFFYPRKLAQKKNDDLSWKFTIDANLAEFHIVEFQWRSGT